ncbi:hypothetical protein V8E54_008950 [Elaphomyces granulatus]|jgi:hypothetical protein
MGSHDLIYPVEKALIPKGWTTDPFFLAVNSLWGPNGDGSEIAQECGLKAPQAVMCTGPETGEALYMFKAGDKFFIWNQIGGEVWQINESRNLNEILEVIHKKDIGGLKLKDIY